MARATTLSTPRMTSSDRWHDTAIVTSALVPDWPSGQAYHLRVRGARLSGGEPWWYISRELRCPDIGTRRYGPHDTKIHVCERSVWGCTVLPQRSRSATCSALV